MLEHAAIVAEMMHACRHTRSDLAARLSEAWSAWWIRNGRVQQALAALTNDAAGVRARTVRRKYLDQQFRLQRPARSWLPDLDEAAGIRRTQRAD